MRVIIIGIMISDAVLNNKFGTKGRICAKKSIQT